LGGERLNLFTIIRCFLRAFLLFFLIISVNIPLVFAQSAESDQSVGISLDPIIAAEQALTLGGAPAAVPAASASSSVWVIIRMLLALILAAAAIYGVVYFIKKFARRSDVQDPYLKILASSRLELNRYVHVISLGSKAWLIGTGENGVNLISEITDNDILNSMFLDDSKKSSHTGYTRFIDFSAILSRMGAKVKPGAAGAENIRKHRERLRGSAE
jgi:flagellar protein FliO/FliZ